MGSLLDRRTAVIHSILAGYERRNVAAMLEHLTDDIEWLPLMTAAEGRAFRGPEEVERWFGEVMDIFDEVSASVEGHRAVGDRILTSGRLRASGRASGAVVDQAVSWLWEFRGDAVRRMEAFSDRDAARAAAGDLVDADH